MAKRLLLFWNIGLILVSFVFIVGTAWAWRNFSARPVQGARPTVPVTTVTRPTPVPKPIAPAPAPQPIPQPSPTPTIPPPTPTPNPTSAVLPARVNLAVPFTSQAPEKNWSQPWQDACEEAAILMMDGYEKKYGTSPLFAKDEIIKMVAWEEARGWGLSIEIEKIKQIFDEYLGYSTSDAKTVIVENPTIEQLKQFIAAGRPVYVVADGKALKNPHFQNGGPEYHALVIRGYTEKTFITNDPGTQFGENYEYPYDRLMNAIRDWNGGDVKSGRRTVLVIQ